MEVIDPATLELLPDGVVVADGAGTVVVVNGRVGRIAQVDQRTAVGRPLAEVLPLVDDDGRPWWSHSRPFDGMSTRTRQPERLLWLSDGTPVFVTASYVRSDGPGSPLRCLVVMLRPASDRTRLERRGAELVATAAHELRSPLTSIKGFTSTLLAKWERFTDAQRRLMLETVEADADRLTRLIGELLDVARIDSGRVRLNPTWVDVEERVRQCVATLVAGGARSERFVVEVAEPVPRIWADPDKVDQIVLNLLENAVRHGDGTTTVVVDRSDILGGTTTSRTTPDVRFDDMTDGGGSDVSASAGTLDESAVTVSVSDEGSGIPEHLVARAFHKFWHTGAGGTGLGLYVVRGMVDAHGGTIQVDRAPSGGARFRFRLPVGQPEING